MVSSEGSTPPAASSKAGGEPAPVEVNTSPSEPGPTATGSPEASNVIIVYLVQTLSQLSLELNLRYKTVKAVLLF